VVVVRVQPEVPSFGEKFSYWFDNFFATDPMAKIYLVVVVNAIFVVFFGCCFHFAGSQDGDWAENFWKGFTFASDAAETDHGGPFPYWQQWVFRAMNLSFSFGGAFVFGMVINFLSDSINTRVEGLKKGKSKVVEAKHTLILGWNDRILPLVDQICQANISEGGMPIVILAEREKEEMDDYWADALEPEKRYGSKIITRGGSRIENPALLKVAVSYARSIIVLSDGADPDEADAQSVRCVLALTGGLAVLGKAPTCHIVVELQDVDNVTVAYLGVTGADVDPADVIVPVVAHDLCGKLMIQCAREVGLSHCFQALLCFAGSECYFSEWPELIGNTFAEAQLRFTDATVIGLRYAPGSGKRPVELNPPGDTRIEYGDKILVLAEDNDTYACGPSNQPNTTPLPPFELPPPKAERILLCGWRRDFDDMIMELDKWCAPNSNLTILSNHGFNPEDAEEDIISEQMNELRKGGMEEFWDDSIPRAGGATGGFRMENITEIRFVLGDPTLRRVLDDMDLESYDSGMVLSTEPDTRSSGDALSADSRVMVSMLLLRSIQVSLGIQGSVLVSEILDPRTQELMSLTQCSDSIVGNELVSMILAQISEERDIGFVIEDLFSQEGCEMHVKDIRAFCAPDEMLSFWDLVNRCQQRNMTLMGWIRKDNVPESDKWTAEINPSNKGEKLRWNGKDQPYGDLLIVLSLD
jgi:hypothetical protein